MNRTESISIRTVAPATPETFIKRLPAAEARFERMPVFDTSFAPAPAQQHEIAIDAAGKIQ
jgi:hypothetical protein